MVERKKWTVHHSFDINVAQEYGVREAILIHHFQHWIRHNKETKKNFYEGRTWSYQTLDEIAAWFPYLSKSEVFDLLERLCEGKGRRSKKEELEFEPVLMKGNYNKSSYDRTIWYAFVDESKWILAQAKMEISQSQNRNCPEPTPIPDTKPDTKKNIKPPPPIASSSTESEPTEQAPPSASGGGGSFIKKEDLLIGDWTYRNARGEAVSISQTRIFQHFLKLSFTTEILKEAIKQAMQSNELIGDPWRYLEAICFRLTQENKPKNEKPKKQEIPVPKNTEPKIGFFELIEKKKREEQEKKTKGE